MGNYLQKPGLHIKKNRFAVKLMSCITAGMLIFSSMSAFASVLGEQTTHTETEYAQGTTYNRNTFQSDSVGQQTENYFEYIPNSDVLPIVSNGDQVFGKRTSVEANEYLNEQGIFAAMGMNADFFSFQTGVPMSDTIVDGKVLTSDQEKLTGVGFNADGTGFISPLQIYISVETPEGTLFDIECLNKYRQPYVMYIYTDEFGDYTNAEGSGTNVVLGNVSGGFSLGQPFTATVESITSDNGSVAIPDGKLVISVDVRGPGEVKDRLNQLYIGQTITVAANEVTGDARWNSAVYGTGCLGGTLLRNGQLDYEDDSAAPRSAVGIKADGSIIFYTIDGRQPGYSYGVRKETLARRLLELGCVDAVNLDGGGSTQLGGTLPETTEFKILNSPSEGLRRCANFIFLKKMNPPDGIPYKLLTYPYGEYVLSGSSVGVWVAAIDKSYGKAEITEPIYYSVESDNTTVGQAVINNDGYATLYGDGDVYFSAVTGEAYGSTMLHSVSNPDSIVIKNESDGSEVSSLSVSSGQTVYLTADSVYQNINLTDSDEAYSWSVSDENLGTISADGTFIPGNVSGTGTINVSAGSVSASVNLTVSAGPEQIPTSTPRPLETDYPTITSSNTGNAFVAKIFGTHGIIDEDNIKMTVDGVKTKFSFSPETMTVEYVYPEDFLNNPHLISVSVTDDEGYSAYKTLSVGDISALTNIFEDTNEHWARDYISYMTKRKVVSGYETDNGFVFRPDKNMTRAEFACMISNYLGLNVYNYRGVELPYADKDEIPDWAFMQVQAMYSLGIMTGQQDGDRVFFSPSSNIKRSEYSVASARLMPSGLYAAPVSAVDAEDIPDWARSSIELLLTQSIMSGYTDGSVRPNNNVTRAEAVKILYGIG